MFSSTTYRQRRARLAEKTGSGLLLLLGNTEVGMNYAANTYHFRQDSQFLYFFGIDRPGLAAIIDTDTGESTIYGDELTMDDIVWTGEVPSIASQSAQSGVARSAPMTKLATALTGKKVHFLPPYRAQNKIWLSELLNLPISEIPAKVSLKMLKAVVALRSIKTAEEVVEIEKAVRITDQMHLAAMKIARPGMTEAEVHAAIQQVVHSHESHTSFPVILTVRGETLHNHHHHNPLQSGQLVLCDCGAESPMHYAGDMTRTFPVDKTFSPRQRDVYSVALASQEAGVAALKPGILYRDVHLESSRVIAEGLKDLGLLKGNVENLVAAGAHALFFQHGLGHLMGLDVHDMEDLGEQYVGYTDDLQKSKQFGLGFLRLGRALEPGFVLTVEPGIYFIPQLIDQWRSEGKFKEFINYDKAEGFKGFGGIRIEEDFLIEEGGARLLGGGVPKSIADIEALRA